MEDKIIITYVKTQKEAISAMLVSKTSKDTTYIINELCGTEADTIYGILVGHLKLAPDQPMYFTIPERKEIDEKNI